MMGSFSNSLNQEQLTITTENLVIGTGVAGLMVALKLARTSKVLVIAKGSTDQSNSYWAQGGIASVFSQEDSFEEHVQDTLVAGAGLCHQDVVKTIVESGPTAIRDLLEIGVKFTKLEGTNEQSQTYHLTKEGGHSRRRVLHADDLTGEALMKALIIAAKGNPNITIFENQFAVDLLSTDKYFPSFSGNYCLGAYVLDLKTSKIYQVRSSKTFLCTGGHGRLYLYTSNPEGATGDGLAMGWRAGCKVANLEFMQFHPTCLFHPEAKTFLISEAVRGEGGILKNVKGEDFTKTYHPKGSLAPRDIVARAIDSELKRTGEHRVFLDLRHMGAEKIKKLFPNIYKTCLAYSIDAAVDMIPVVPAAHYSCGGLVIDSWGRTSVNHLYAIGEVACSGLHGANRLASNSLLEACVLADRAVQKAVEQGPHGYDSSPIPAWDAGETLPPDEQVLLSHTWDEIRRLMWNYVGIVRSERRLQRAFARIQTIRQELDTYYWEYKVNDRLLEVRNLAEIAWLTIRCAMSRKESRGIHFIIENKNSFKDSLPKDTIICH
ncbi:MAG: L-aspartate oxidase [Oligoflexales bacterium]